MLLNACDSLSSQWFILNEESSENTTGKKKIIGLGFL